jgi:hypothetical protein
MCLHKSWADKCEVTEQKASTKLVKQVKSEGPSACPKCKKLGHSIKNCFLNIKDKEARKKAQVQAPSRLGRDHTPARPGLLSGEFMC